MGRLQSITREYQSLASGAAKLPVPQGLAYKKFQQDGIERMLRTGRMINADEMGLGKTVQAIGCINATSSIKTVLILCPKSMLHTWANELKRWLTRPLTIGIGGVSGEALPNCDILLINYDMISRRKAEVIARGPLDALICCLLYTSPSPRDS